MTIKELASMYNVNVKNKGMKNKNKAKEMIEKFLKCPKCKKTMTWIDGTNVCTCPICTYTVSKKVNKKEVQETYSVYKTISEKSRIFLENNYLQFAKESTEV